MDDVNYEECHKTCKCFYFDEDKKECMYKQLCMILELPIATDENMEEDMRGI
jgi:hypothetical protein